MYSEKLWHSVYVHYTFLYTFISDNKTLPVFFLYYEILSYTLYQTFKAMKRAFKGSEIYKIDKTEQTVESSYYF